MEWSAGQINDPIVRLRFLQQVAPRMRLALFWRRWHWAIIAVLLTLAAIPAVYRFTPIRAIVQPSPVSASIQRVEPAAIQSVAAQPGAGLPEVWQVEKSGNSETYSNGLRIDDRFTVANHPRSYLAFPVSRPSDTAGVTRSEPVGIVFHTTESRQAPFEADQNRILKKIGESLLEYVRRKRAYHFLIDRFGRVFRVVAESDAANHSGNSVWSDDQYLYVNLNESFLGVSVEAETHPGQEQASMSPAQVRSAAMLTEMLRGKYHIAAQNCVTHAQVSVNPSNLQIGYHTDWASSFPFEQLGLPDNYAQPLPALWAFGFEYNPEFLHWAGGRIEAGLQLAEQRLSQGAADAGVPVRAYRKSLQKRYRESLAAVRGRSLQAIPAGQSEESE